MNYPKFVPYILKTSLISVTAYENKIIEGTVSNPFFDKEMSFKGTIQLLLLLDKLQDDLDFPQRQMETRSFKNGIKPDSNAVEAKTTAKALATFKLTIMFRQNASWQGTLLWVNKNETAQFRSVLEMMMLLDSALAEEDGGAK